MEMVATDPAMGKVRRGGYVFEWWIGDHPPRHVHVSDQQGKFLGRVRIDTKAALDDWKPPRKVVELIQELKDEGRL
jgi:hypothetical protein